MSTYRHPGTVLTEYVFGVPLDHGRPGGEQIEVFAREVVGVGRERDNLPWLLFLQGGPGFHADRAVGRARWLDRALRDYRVLLLDQRGTGRSTPVSAGSLARRGLASPAAQADYLALFRADSIVADAELIRRELAGGEPWALLGQSFGGFCTVAYLSWYPEGIREAFITGGLPGLASAPDDVYRLTYPLVAGKVAAHYERYPMDVTRARDIARQLADRTVTLPDGRPLTVEAFQSLGMPLGFGAGSHELHYLLEDALDGDGELADGFLYEAMRQLSFAGNPLYALVHEACYAQGAATRWSAQRVRAELGGFDAAGAGRRRPAAVHRRDDLPVDRGAGPGARAAARDGGAPRPAGRLAAPVRPGPAGRVQRASRGGRLLRRHVRPARAVHGDGGGDRRAARLGDQ